MALFYCRILIYGAVSLLVNKKNINKKRGRNPDMPGHGRDDGETDDYRNIANFLNAILDNIPHMVFVKEAKQLRFVRFNKAGEKLLGYKRQEMIGKNDYDFFPREQADFFTQKDRQVLEKDEITDIPEEPINTREGLRWLHTKKIPIKDERGNPMFLLGISEDITDKRKSREQLQQLGDIIESSPDFVGYGRADNAQVLYINPAGKEMCGLSGDEDVTKYKIFDLHPVHVNKMLREEILPYAAEHMAWRGEAAFKNLKTGAEIPVSMLVLCHRNSKGEAEKFSTISRDITEEKKREKQITRLNEDLANKTLFLETSNQEMQSFTYSISHDLRSPIRALNGFTKIFENRYSALIDDEGKKMLETISSNAKRMGQLVDGLLTFSHLRKREIEKTTVDMNAIAKEAIDELTRLSGDAFHGKIVMQELPPANCDAALTRQVWINLIDNAIKFSRPKAKPLIEIGCHQKDGETIYYVKDNGAGFDMRYYNKLFGVFQRLHHASEFAGTGIGLALVKRIVERHGGRVWGEGRLNEGATFYFTICAAENAGK